MRKRHPDHPACAIKGCDRAQFKGKLCRAHYQLVPLKMGLDAAAAIMIAQRREGERQHAKQLRYVRDLLAKEAA